MPVPFRFDTVLRIRETERDAKRQAFAVGQARETTLRTERDRIADERLHALDELRTLQATDGWTVEQAMTRQQHAQHLARELATAEAALSEAIAQSAWQRQELLEADTAVKALEKLADRHRSGQTNAELVQDERDRDDIRRSGRAA
jgi:flagellar biosynthesis chaperone FliJ